MHRIQRRYCVVWQAAEEITAGLCAPSPVTRCRHVLGPHSLSRRIILCIQRREAGNRQARHATGRVRVQVLVNLQHVAFAFRVDAR